MHERALWVAAYIPQDREIARPFLSDYTVGWCRRERLQQPRRPPLAKFRPGSPAPGGRRPVLDIAPRRGAVSDVVLQVSQWRVTQQAAISRPNSFPSHPRGPSWTWRRTTRSGQSRPRLRFPLSMRAFASPHVALSLPRGSHIFSPPQREVVHKCAKFFGARAERRRAKVSASICAFSAPFVLTCRSGNRRVSSHL